MQENKEAESSAAFFRLVSCQQKDAAFLNVGMVYEAALLQQMQRGGDAPAMAAGIASNLQSQILALWLDKMMRVKSQDRFRTLVWMRFGSQDISCGNSVCVVSK